jgi:sporulation protein YlmC with PRC-barrel domain
MSMLKSTTALALAIGLGMGLTPAGPAAAAGSGEKASTTGTGYEKASPSTTGAASETPGAATSTGASQSTIPGGITAEELIGRNVVNRNGENVGEVESLVVQPKKNEVHAVISVGGFLGMGDRDVAIPLKDLEIGEDNVTLMSQQTKEDLEALPEYEEDQWEMWSGPASTEPQEKTQQ